MVSDYLDGGKGKIQFTGDARARHTAAFMKLAQRAVFKQQVLRRVTDSPQISINSEERVAAEGYKGFCLSGSIGAGAITPYGFTRMTEIYEMSQRRKKLLLLGG